MRLRDVTQDLVQDARYAIRTLRRDLGFVRENTGDPSPAVEAPESLSSPSSTGPQQEAPAEVLAAVRRFVDVSPAPPPRT